MNTNKSATRSVNRKLLAALAVLAVAFVVLAAIPSASETNSDAATTYTDVSDVTTFLAGSENGMKLTSDIAVALTENTVVSAKAIDLNGKTLTVTSSGTANYTLTLSATVVTQTFLGNTSSTAAKIVVTGSGLTITNASATAFDPATFTNSDYHLINATSGNNHGITFTATSGSTITVDAPQNHGSTIATGANDHVVFSLDASQYIYDGGSAMNVGMILKNGSSANITTDSGTTYAAYWALDASTVTGDNLDAYAASIGNGSTFNATGKLALYPVGTAFNTHTDAVLSGMTPATIAVGIGANDSSKIVADDIYTSGFYLNPSTSLTPVTFTGTGSIEGDLNLVNPVVSNGNNVNRVALQGYTIMGGVTVNGTLSYDGNSIVLQNVVGIDSGLTLSGTAATGTAASNLAINGSYVAGSDTSITISEGNAVIGSGMTAAVPANSELIIADGANLTNSGILVLADEDDLVATGSYVQTSNAATKLGILMSSEDIYIVGTGYSYKGVVYTIHSRVINEDTVYYGVAIQDIAYLGRAVVDTDITSNFYPISTTNYTLTPGAFTMDKTGCQYPGSYSNAVKVVVGWSNSSDKTSGSFTDYADLVITKIDIEKATVANEELTYTGSALDPTFTVTANGINLVYGTDYEVKYTSGNLTNKHVVNAGSYTATITALSGSQFFQGVKNVTFTVDKAKASVTISLNQTWTDRAYVAENVTYSVVSDKTASVNAYIGKADSTGKITYGTATPLVDTVTSGVVTKTAQSVLDDLLKEQKSTDFKSFTYTLKIEVSVSMNYLKAEATQEIVVGDFVKLTDFVVFTKDKTVATEVITKVKQAGFGVAINGTLANTSVKEDQYEYSFTFNVAVDENASDIVSLSFARDGNAKFASADENVTIGTPVADSTNGGFIVIVTIKEALPVTTPITLTVTAAADETKYTTAVYTIDLSAVGPSEFSIEFVEDGYTTLIYASKDGTTVNYAMGSYFQVPSTANSSVWKLNGVTYQAGSVYVVAVADIVSGKITFTATGSSTPVTPDTPAEHGTSIIASLIYSNGALHLLVATPDKALLPEGTMTVAITAITTGTEDGVTYQDNEKLAAQMFAVGDSAYDYVTLDLSGAVDTVIGAFAVVTIGDVTFTTSTIGF